eukprot:jgi/Botrbrau1/6871/Bobra.152_2s0029.2
MTNMHLISAVAFLLLLGRGAADYARQKGVLCSPCDRSLGCDLLDTEYGFVTTFEKGHITAGTVLHTGTVLECHVAEGTVLDPRLQGRCVPSWLPGKEHFCSAYFEDPFSQDSNLVPPVPSPSDDGSLLLNNPDQASSQQGTDEAVEAVLPTYQRPGVLNGAKCSPWRPCALQGAGRVALSVNPAKDAEAVVDTWQSRDAARDRRKLIIWEQHYRALSERNSRTFWSAQASTSLPAQEALRAAASLAEGPTILPAAPPSNDGASPPALFPKAPPPPASPVAQSPGDDGGATPPRTPPPPPKTTAGDGVTPPPPPTNCVCRRRSLAEMNAEQEGPLLVSPPPPAPVERRRLTFGLLFGLWSSLMRTNTGRTTTPSPQQAADAVQTQVPTTSPSPPPPKTVVQTTVFLSASPPPIVFPPPPPRKMLIGNVPSSPPPPPPMVCVCSPPPGTTQASFAVANNAGPTTTSNAAATAAGASNDFVVTTISQKSLAAQESVDSLQGFRDVSAEVSAPPPPNSSNLSEWNSLSTFLDKANGMPAKGNGRRSMVEGSSEADLSLTAGDHLPTGSKKDSNAMHMVEPKTPPSSQSQAEQGKEGQDMLAFFSSPPPPSRVVYVMASAPPPRWDTTVSPPGPATFNGVMVVPDLAQDAGPDTEAAESPPSVEMTFVGADFDWAQPRFEAQESDNWDLPLSSSGDAMMGLDKTLTINVMRPRRSLLSALSTWSPFSLPASGNQEDGISGNEWDQEMEADSPEVEEAGLNEDPRFAWAAPRFVNLEEEAAPLVDEAFPDNDMDLLHPASHPKHSLLSLLAGLSAAISI